ncbi:unnamed protein product [Adineta ricciae]|uniref:Uncharacterized protein n=1 Tax=Adineta ricciae TaxID=249248 RepID=A0A813WJK6_ADIRI|nr:unnamed protein product [Adineta ricciae]CAF1063092.1 unnamed protein product [Adineta ricciae]
MDLYNHNATKKRKLNQPNAHEDESKRKTSKSTGCFGRCCSRKRQDTPFETKEKPVKQVNNKVALATENGHLPVQTSAGAGDKESSTQVTHLSQSPLEYKSGTNLNDLDNSNTKLFYENQYASIEQADTATKEKTTNGTLDESFNPFQNTVNSFVNDIIGDGIGQLSELLAATNAYVNTLIMNSASAREDNELAFQKQDMELSTDQTLAQPISDNYDWNIESNKTNFDQDNLSIGDKSSQNQEPYHWEDQYYSWSHRSEQTFLSDNDIINSTYSVGTRLPSNQKANVQSQIADIEKETTGLLTMSSTSVSELFKHMTRIRQEKELDLDSISTAYSVPISMRHSILSEVSNVPSQTQPMLAKHATNRLLSIFNSNDIMRFWQSFLERLSNFLLPSSHNMTNDDVNFNKYSWTTLTCTDIISSDEFGPRWSRRDIDDRSPATFVFVNDPLSTWYSLETCPSNKQRCTSIHYRPCCPK